MTTYESNPTGPMASGSIATPAGALAAAGGDGALNGQRNPDELRAELSRLRTEVGETLEALIQRLDVPARVQGKAREVTERAKQTATQVVDQAQQKAQDASQLVAQKVPGVVKQRRAQTAALAGVVMLVGLLVTGIVVRRSR
ncbi:MAG: hypothetical protein JWR88_1253 [Pseudonocardia sp.]|nr:hypothetical protein [Pseudonocardia sp.]